MRLSINILKVLGILLILLRHVGWYFQLPMEDLLSTLFLPMGELGVHIFLFCSGYGLTYSALRSDDFVLSTYWKKRFIRIYPLYIISLLLYTQFIYQIDLKNFIVHAVFLHSFFLEMSHNPDPLWYMGVLFQFYLVFPLWYKIRPRSPKIFWGSVVVLFVVNFIVIFFINSTIPFTQRLNSNVEDSSMFSFIVPIATGISLARYSYNNSIGSIFSLRKNFIIATVSGLLFLFVYIYVLEGTYQSFYEGVKIIFPLLSSLVILFSITLFDRLNGKINEKIINFASSGVFCCYLFHEFIFHFFSQYITKSFLIIPIAIFFALLSGVYVQRWYNFTLNYIRIL